MTQTRPERDSVYSREENSAVSVGVCSEYRGLAPIRTANRERNRPQDRRRSNETGALWTGGKAKPGLIDDAGKLRDSPRIIPDLAPKQLSNKALAKLAKLNRASLPLARGSPRAGVRVAQVGKLVGIGLDYSDHAAQAGMAIPKEDRFLESDQFAFRSERSRDAAARLKEIGLGDRARGGHRTVARSVAEKSALEHVAGYCIVNDISEREHQLERGKHWDKGKGCGTFGPVGPWLVTRNELSNPQCLELWLDANGMRRQTGYDDKPADRLRRQ